MGGDSSPVVICRYNQRGLCKYGERCKRQHIYEECNDDECKSILCTKRHPLLCNFYVQNGFCRFKERCAFAHRKTKAENETQKLSIEVAKLKAEIENIKHEKGVSLTKKLNDSTTEDVKNLKAEVDVMKNTIKSIISIRQEGKSLKKSIGEIKEDIKYLRALNEDTIKRIKIVEEDFEEESEEEDNSESLFTCNYCGSQFSHREHFEKHIENHENESRSNENDSLDILYGEQFQIEVLGNGEVLYCCNICNEGLESEKSIVEHIIGTHKDELNEIEQDNDESDENEGKKQKQKACNDTNCFRIGKDKCLCYYDKESDDNEG